MTKTSWHVPCVIGTSVRLSNGGQIGRIYSLGTNKGYAMIRWSLTGVFTWERQADLRLV